jgi:hypothetical protein
MSHLKKLVFILSLTTLALCFVGATSAFAVDSEVVFCKKNQALCESAAILPAGTALKMLSEDLRFLGKPEMKCEHTETNGKTLQSMSELLEVEMTSMSFSGCSVCEAVDAEGLPRRYKIWMSGAFYYVNFAVKFTLLGCGESKVSCQYGAELVEVPFENTESGEPIITVSKVLAFQGGSGGEVFCGKTTAWDGSFRVTTTKGPMWLSLFKL